MADPARTPWVKSAAFGTGLAVGDQENRLTTTPMKSRRALMHFLCFVPVEGKVKCNASSLFRVARKIREPVVLSHAAVHRSEPVPLLTTLVAKND